MSTATATALKPPLAIAAQRSNAGGADCERKRKHLHLDRSQLQFDWLLGDRQWWTLAAAASVCGVSESFLEKLFDEGKQLSGHEFNGGRGARMTKRIPRAWLVALLVNTARYGAATRLEAYLSCLKHFSREEREQIARAANC